MTSIIAAVFKATFGVLVKKGQDKVAEQLKEGDVTDQKLRGLIIRELEDIKLKVEGLSRKDLLAALDFFEAGLRYVYKAVDAHPSEMASAEVVTERNFPEVSLLSPDMAKTVSLAAETIDMKNTRSIPFDEKSKSALRQAKERFGMAREKATDAFNNEALSTFDRITAIRYRVVSAMLESAVEAVGTVEDFLSLSLKSALENAIPECEQCLQKLHSLPAVQNSFKVQFQKGLNLRRRFGKDERMEVISTVCQVNRTVYDVMQAVGKSTNMWVWPCVDIKDEQIDPLRDARAKNVLRTVGAERCCVIPSLPGQECDEEHRLKNPVGVTNMLGYLLIADDEDKTLKRFDRKGNFVDSINLNPHTTHENALSKILRIATDEENIHILIRWQKHPVPSDRFLNMFERILEVQVLNKTTELQQSFLVRGMEGPEMRLAVVDSKVIVLQVGSVFHEGDIAVYEKNGTFVCNFDEEVCRDATDITSGNDGKVIVMDGKNCCVHLLTVEGRRLGKLNISTQRDHVFNVIASYPECEDIVVAGLEPMTRCLSLAKLTAKGTFIRRMQLSVRVPDFRECITGITVTAEGQIVLVTESDWKWFSRPGCGRHKVVVV